MSGRGVRTTYDPEADAIGIYFAPDGSNYAESEEVAPGIVLDFDSEGRVIGVELRYVRELLATGARPQSDPREAIPNPAVAQ